MRDLTGLSAYEMQAVEVERRLDQLLPSRNGRSVPLGQSGESEGKLMLAAKLDYLNLPEAVHNRGGEKLPSC